MMIDLHVLWQSVTEAAKEDARKLQAILSPVLRSWDDPLVTHEALELVAVDSYSKVFSRSISTRQIRRIVTRAIDRDGGRNDWARPELFLPENAPIRRAERDGPEFAELSDLIDGFAVAGEPTPGELEALWREAWRIHEERLAGGVAPKRAKAELLSFVSTRLPGLLRGSSRNGLRMTIARHFRRLADSAPSDARRARRGETVAPAIPQADIELLAGTAVEKYGGRLAQAARKLVRMGEASGLMSATRDLLDAGAGKSYVNARVREEVGPLIKCIAPYRRGKKAVDDATASIQRDYSNLRSMEMVTADDFTFPVYFYVPDGKGWFDLTRGQCLLFIDVKSLKVLGWTLIPERNYTGMHVRTCMNSVCMEHGRPDFWYFERGIWERSNLVKGKPPKAWRLAQSSFVDARNGWEKLGVRFIHAKRARSKPNVEFVGGLLQNLMEGEQGYCGRNERIDCPEVTKRAVLAVQAKRSHPSRHFYGFDEWVTRLGALVDSYNADCQQGRLGGLSPDGAFQQAWSTNDPPARFDAACWHLCAHYVSERKVTEEGIDFDLGKSRFHYYDENLSRWRNRQVLAWFDPGHPEILGVTDTDGKQAFFVQRTNPVDVAAAYRGGAPADRYQVELAKQAGFNAHPKAAYRVCKARFDRVFRPNLVDRQTAATGAELLSKRSAALEVGKTDDTRRNRIVRLCGKLSIPLETLIDFSAETESALQRTLERRKEPEEVQ